MMLQWHCLKPKRRLISPNPNHPLFADPALTLPPELSSQILQHILRPETEQKATLLHEQRQMLLILSRLNRSWYDLARPHLFAYITINSSPKDALVAESLQKDPSLAIRMRSLEFGAGGKRGEWALVCLEGAEKSVAVGERIQDVAVWGVGGNPIAMEKLGGRFVNLTHLTSLALEYVELPSTFPIFPQVKKLSLSRVAFGYPRLIADSFPDVEEFSYEPAFSLFSSATQRSFLLAIAPALRILRLQGRSLPHSLAAEILRCGELLETLECVGIGAPPSPPPTYPPLDRPSLPELFIRAAPFGFDKQAKDSITKDDLAERIAQATHLEALITARLIATLSVESSVVKEERKLLNDLSYATLDEVVQVARERLGKLGVSLGFREANDAWFS